jgi:hypothetical protein
MRPNRNRLDPRNLSQKSLAAHAGLHPLDRSNQFPGDARLAHQWPASGTTMYSASGHARASVSR